MEREQRTLGDRRKWIAAGLAGLFAALLSQPAGAACQQPVYVIAHRCNDNDQVSSVVRNQGVNAIEADFSYGRAVIGQDEHWAAEHDPPVALWSTHIADWLDDVKEVVGPGSPLALIIFDIKTPEGPLAELYHAARIKLGPDINLLFSIGDFSQRLQFRQLADLINNDPRAGVAIDYLPDANQWMVHDFFRLGLQSPVSWLSMPPIRKYWFGDGICAGCSTPGHVQTNVNDGIALRNSTCDAFHGVYAWTYEKESSIQNLLNGGINGIMVNASECQGFASPATAWDPSQAVDHAKTLLSRKFATPADNPFAWQPPEIVCPQDTVVECTTWGGSWASDSQVDAFLHGITAAGCEQVSRTYGGGDFFGLGRHQVKFTETGSCGRSASCTAYLTVQDTTNPVLHDCQDIEREPDSPYGTAVTYPVTATDVCDGAVTLDCNPRSGTTFRTGTQTDVSCAATDFSQRKASCSFKVKILSYAEVVGVLRAAVVSAPSLNEGQKKGLRSELDALLDSIARNNTRAACGQLQGFLAKIGNWVEHGHLTAAEGQPMIKSATNLRNALGCSK